MPFALDLRPKSGRTMSFLKYITALLASIATLFALSYACPAWAQSKFQSCSGVMAFDEAGFRLQSGLGNKSLWCDAYLDHHFSNDTKAVLSACPIGSTCRLEGRFVGHGVFYWTTINLVRVLNLAISDIAELRQTCTKLLADRMALSECYKRLDETYGWFLTKQYDGLRSKLSGIERQELIQSQRSWLKSQEQTCRGKVTLVDQELCNLDATLKRILELVSQGK